MTKIIYTSAEDFISQEIDEHGFEYVDRQFALGYEPGLVTALGQSFYVWVKVDNVLQSMAHDTSSNHRVTCSLPDSGSAVVRSLAT